MPAVAYYVALYTMLVHLWFQISCKLQLQLKVRDITRAWLRAWCHECHVTQGVCVVWLVNQCSLDKSAAASLV